MQRRKSRLSTLAPTNVDLDYAGNTNTVVHLINKVGSPRGGSATQAEINFAMNLRGYKCTTNYIAEQPWEYPQKKEFKVAEIYKEAKESIRQTQN